MNRQLIPLKIIRKRLGDGIYRTGLVLLAVSLIIFCIPELVHVEDTTSWFLINHAITVLYFLILLFNGRLRHGRDGLHPFFLFLLMFLVSAYALNRFFSVFNESAPWFAVTIIICSVNYVAFAFLRLMPVPVRVVMFSLLGVAICCFLYMTFYIMPYTFLGIIVFFFFGISLHGLVPILFFLYTVRLYHRSYAYKRAYVIAFWSGIGITVLAVIVYALLWRVRVVQLDTAYHQVVATENSMPQWLNASKQITPDPVMEKILKCEMVYSVSNSWLEGDLFGRISGSWNEKKKHDPLVMIASLLGGTTVVPQEDRIHILESLYDSRYEAEERLWSGEELLTTHVQTSARIWPQLRMAYTEKTLNVKNLSSRNSDQQEAIYRFHLPEGAVVSSLSLWIKNNEQKGILTTKAKADSAYKTIVGGESRDPSVVHWQEGNIVSVRVFPVMGNEERRFKIGITAPLSFERGKLLYRNIYFDGPSTGSTREDVDVSFETSPVDLKKSSIFSTNANNKLTSSGRYRADWQVSFKDEGLAYQQFSNNGRIFTVAPYRKEPGAADIRDVYLDVNSAWDEHEFNHVLALFPQQRVWVYNNGQLEQVTAENKTDLFEQVSAYRFSLFPFFEIQKPETALVITKGVVNSPGVGDLKESAFMDALRKWLTADHQVMLFNLGGELSPYLRTLKECRAFRYDQGDLAALRLLLDDHRFPANIENDQRIVIESANMTISTAPGTSAVTAPDHLQRLFAYNHIMHAMGPHLLTGGLESDTLVKEAEEAYIVTPLSSLVVLETQADYDRFNIEDSNNSLKNASLKGKGAVPEPHEWALIVIGILLLVYLKFKPVLYKRVAKI